MHYCHENKVTAKVHNSRQINKLKEKKKTKKNIQA